METDDESASQMRAAVHASDLAATSGTYVEASVRRSPGPWNRPPVTVPSAAHHASVSKKPRGKDDIHIASTHSTRQSLSCSVATGKGGNQSCLQPVLKHPASPGTTAGQPNSRRDGPSPFFCSGRYPSGTHGLDSPFDLGWCPRPRTAMRRSACPEEALHWRRALWGIVGGAGAGEIKTGDLEGRGRSQPSETKHFHW